MASVLELILRSRKEGDAAKKTEAELKRLEKASGGAAKAAKKLNLGMLAVQGAVITAGTAFLKSIPAILDQGVEIQRAETALIAYAGSSEEASRAISLMKDSTKGAISEMNMMQNATRLMAMGLAKNAEEAANLTKTATTLGATMGIGPHQALERFTLLLANQSILRLDTFGISADEVKRRMQKLTAEGIAPTDRQLRFLTATMEAADKRMGVLEAAGYDAYSSVDRLRAGIEDTKAAVITWLADGLMPWIDGLYALKDAQREHGETIVHSTDSYEDYTEEAIRSGIAIEKWGVAIGIATEAQWNSARAAEGLVPAYAGMIAKVTELQGVTEELAVANTAVALSLGDITQATLAKEAMEGLNEAWGEGLLSEEDYKSMYTDIALNIAGLDQPAIDAKLRLFDMQQQLAETGELGTYIGMVGDLGREIGALPDYKKIKIELLIERLGEEEGMFQRGGSFIVRGPPGPDKVPVRFMATSGERVTVTPAGQTLHQEDQRQFLQGAQMNFNRPIDEDVFLEQIRRIAS